MRCTISLRVGYLSVCVSIIFHFAASLILERGVGSTVSPQFATELVETVTLVEQQRRRIITQYEFARRRYTPLLLEPFDHGLF
ncbi:hypothetical protein [Geobacillus kaustophilus]|uniref:hypothetical protein n=1 Tax=Geobacillus kaustophilus TaxID=1462 RepID=UPI000A923EAA|nr:hypothetical protein [Geobacillus kaustophilus]